jgi:hypothetical protein
MAWLESAHPDLVADYRALYGWGAYLPAGYRNMLRSRVTPLITKHGLGADSRPFAMRSAPAAQAAGALQPTLF